MYIINGCNNDKMMQWSCARVFSGFGAHLATISILVIFGHFEQSGGHGADLEAEWSLSVSQIMI